MAEKFKALKESKEALEFFANDDPKCPHCGEVCSISDNEWWNCYEEGDHEVTCPSCELDFTVATKVSFSFSTEEQEGFEDEA